MSCIKLIAPDGSVRSIEEGKPYKKIVGEKSLGRDPECNGKVAPITVRVGNKTNSLLKELNDAIGPGIGDWVKVMAEPVAKVLGKTGCVPCQAKSVVLNAFSKLRNKYGLIKAGSITAELFKLASNDPNEAALKLKEYIE